MKAGGWRRPARLLLYPNSFTTHQTVIPFTTENKREASLSTRLSTPHYRHLFPPFCLHSKSITAESSNLHFYHLKLKPIRIPYSLTFSLLNQAFLPTIFLHSSIFGYSKPFTFTQPHKYHKYMRTFYPCGKTTWHFLTRHNQNLSLHQTQTSTITTITTSLTTVTTVPSTADIPDTLTTVHYYNHKGTASPNTPANTTQPIQHSPKPRAYTLTTRTRTHASHAHTPARNPRTRTHRLASYATILTALTFAQLIFRIITQASTTTRPTFPPRLSPNLATSTITLSFTTFHYHCTYFFRTKNTFLFSLHSLIVVSSRSFWTLILTNHRLSMKFHSLKMKHFPNVSKLLRKRADEHRRRTRRSNNANT